MSSNIIFTEHSQHIPKKKKGILKSNIETLQEENSKLRHDICVKGISIKRLMEIMNEERAK